MANPNTDRVLMSAIQQVGLTGTQLSAMGGTVVINDAYTLSSGITPQGVPVTFPALLLTVGTQKHTVVTYAGYDGVIQILATYYDRWDQQPNTIDTIRVNIDSDCQLIMTNIQHNSSLTVGNVSHAISIPTIELSHYEGEIEWKQVPGLVLVKRILTFFVNILPYDV